MSGLTKYDRAHGLDRGEGNSPMPCDVEKGDVIWGNQPS